MLNELRASSVLFVILFVVTGVIYPLVTWQTAQKLFPYQANGSLIEENGKIIGSELIGQSFVAEKYFHPRPSAAQYGFVAGVMRDGYDASNSSGSNLAPTSAELIKAIGERASALKSLSADAPFPVDLVTSSASGLDPHISPDAAKIQSGRVAAVRHLDVAQVKDLIEQATEPRTLGLIGDERVNVLKLNRALDLLASTTPQ